MKRKTFGKLIGNLIVGIDVFEDDTLVGANMLAKKMIALIDMPGTGLHLGSLGDGDGAFIVFKDLGFDDREWIFLVEAGRKFGNDAAKGQKDAHCIGKGDVFGLG